jgi:hypothetical protein
VEEVPKEMTVNLNDQRVITILKKFQESLKKLSELTYNEWLLENDDDLDCFTRYSIVFRPTILFSS